jgi:glycosyltransferase involved in cell wall biosynthesis
MPCYNEEKNIRNAVESFFATGFVDVVLTVDNNSTDLTKSEILKTNATYILETNQGYGAAIIAGLKNVNSDLVITVEPDGTFKASDVQKFLIYSEEFEVVFGSRTSTTLIWEGAYMPAWVKFGNWFCAKEIEILFSGPSLSDVGCTYKLINRGALNKVKNELYVEGSHFSPHFMITCIQNRLKCAEIPIHYGPRVGESKITGGNVPRTIQLGLYMLFYIFYSRFKKKSVKGNNDG